jgi:diguanylate cyclase (GGDEF)-like protein
MEFKNGLEELKNEIARLIDAEDGASLAYYHSRISELTKDEERLGRFFSSLLEVFVHLEFDEEEAVRHWNRIVAHGRLLSRGLERGVGVHMAIVDYFTSVSHLLKTPMLIEIHAFKQTERLAMMDGLTGVFNRRYMEMALKKEFNRCSRYGKNLSVFILDIDDFKRLNDSRGHAFGDETLRELAGFLKSMVREEDAVCRYGGEEFLVILPETSGAGAFALAERIRRKLKESAFFRDNRIAFSGGTASYPETGASAEQLVNAADRALYMAKSAGKDRVVRAAPERRRHDRFPRSWSLTVDVVDGEGGKKKPEAATHVSDIMTLNVSMGGVRFECPSRLDIDEAVELDFIAMDSSGENLSARGRVSWAKKEDRDLFSYGVSFSELSEQAAELLAGSLAERDLALREAAVNPCAE